MFKAYSIQHHCLIYIYRKMMTTVGSANIHHLFRYNKKKKEKQEIYFLLVMSSYDLLS